ncbi:hypothetical protein AAMO2058_001070900 [Amorphochlora amoebiformis]
MGLCTSKDETKSGGKPAISVHPEHYSPRKVVPSPDTFIGRCVLPERLSARSRDLCAYLDAYSLTLLVRYPVKIMEYNKINHGGTADQLTLENTTLGWKWNKEGSLKDMFKRSDRKSMYQTLWSDPKSWVPAKTKSTADVPVTDSKGKKLVIKEDAIFSSFQAKEKVVLTFLRNCLLFPCKDIFVDAFPQDIAWLLKEMNLVEGKTLPYKKHDLKELESDESLSWLFFYGAGAVYIRECNDEKEAKEFGPFVADFNHFHDLEVRRGFRRYGARIHFDKDQKPTAIYDYDRKVLCRPNDIGWPHAKFLLKATFTASIVVHDHLTFTHILAANTLVNAKTDCLPPWHPLRRLLEPFTFRTSYINEAASITLFPKLSMLHRMSGFTHEAILELVKRGVPRSEILQPFPDRKVGPTIQKLTEENHFPYRSDGIMLFNEMEKLVRRWISAAKEGGYDPEDDKYSKLFYARFQERSKNQKYEPPEYREVTKLKPSRIVTQLLTEPLTRC